MSFLGVGTIVFSFYKRLRSRFSFHRPLANSLLFLGRPWRPRSINESEAVTLHQRYPRRDVYKYDEASKKRRAICRFNELCSVIDFGGVKEIAELGAGDGQLALLFAQKGYSTVILDTDDWRDPEVYQSDIKFVKVEESAEYEISDNSVDLFVSYGTLEHVADPHYVLQEAIRVTRPGGNIFLLFGPLYNSPWGLHAYETFYAPYPQFLLSESTMKRFVEANGIWDLGAKRENFQYVNGWSARNYDELIDSLMGQVSIRHLSKTYCYKEIDVVYKYLRSFIGCGLDFEELTREEMTVCLTVRDKARTGYGSHDEILIKQSELQNDAEAA